MYINLKTFQQLTKFNMDRKHWIIPGNLLNLAILVRFVQKRQFSHHFTEKYQDNTIRDSIKY